MVELPLVGGEFAGYRLLSVIGGGGMSIVFRAENPRSGNVTALKVLDPSLASDDIFRTRFLEESRIAASMNHPNVIPVHDSGSSSGLLYIAMRFVAGTDLRQLLRMRGRLAPDTAVLLLSQAARGLDAAHRRGLVHRDVKPGNMLVERGSDGADPDHVYLTDFGITRHPAGRAGRISTGAFPGTTDYVAPEQVRGISVLGLADQYSLGCILYECLAGRVPFGNDLRTNEAPARLTLLRPDLPAAVDDLFARVLATNPGDRYATCHEFMTAAREALGPLAAPRFPGPELGGPVLADAKGTAAGYLDWADESAHETDTGWGGEAPTASWPVPPPAPTASWAAPPGPPPAPTASWQVPPVTAGDTGPGTGEPRPKHDRRGGVVALALLLVAGAAALVLFGFKTASKQASSTAALAAGGLTAGKSPAAGTGSNVPSLALPTVTGTIRIGNNPSYVAVAPNGEFAYATDPGAGDIAVLNTATDLVSGTVQIPQGPPQFVSFSPDSRTAYVSVYNTQGTVHLIAFVDTATGKVTSTATVNNFTPGVSAISPDGQYLYVPNHNMAMTGANENAVDVIDLAKGRLVNSIAVPANPHWAVFEDGRLYTSDHMSALVTVISLATNKVIDEIDVGETPHSEAISPDGSRLAVTSYSGNEVFIVNTSTEKWIATIPVGRMPLNIAYSPNGEYLFTTNNDDNDVTAINALDDHVIGTIPTGKEPTSIAVLPNGRQAYVTDSGSGTIAILNIAQASAPPASVTPSSPAPAAPSSRAASASMSGMPGM